MKLVLLSICIGLLARPVLSAESLKPRATISLRGDKYEDHGVMSVAFAPDGKTIAAVTTEGKIALWDVATHKKVFALQGDRSSPWSQTINSVAYSPDGRVLAWGGPGRVIVLLDTVSHKKTTIPVEHSPVFSIAFSPDGKTLVFSFGSPGDIGVWDVAAGKKMMPTFRGHFEEITSIALSPDGKTVASAGGEKGLPGADWVGTIRLWGFIERLTLNNIGTIHSTSHRISCVVFSPDGKTLASGENDKAIRLWNVNTGKNTATLNGHTEEVFSVAFSPDGKTLASGSKDRTVRLWDVATGKNTATLMGHTEIVCTVAFSPDGKTVASGSLDQTVKLWDVGGSRPL